MIIMTEFGDNSLKYLKYLKDIVDKFSSLPHDCWYC